MWEGGEIDTFKLIYWSKLMEEFFRIIFIIDKLENQKHYFPMFKFHEK